LCKVAAELQVVIVASLFERRSAGLYHNTAAVIDADGRYLGKYRKMHIPDDPLFYEKFYFTPGDLGFRSWKTRYADIGVCICWDQWYPEAARLTALRGAQILFYPTAIGWHPSEKAEYGVRQHSSWETIQRSHAIANGCYVAVTNRVGHEAPDGGPGLEFWGQSFVADPAGQIVAKASVDCEEVMVTEIDLDALETQRTHWPFFRDRRIDAYQGIDRRFLEEGDV
jgi:N-carbamoylputrescine amidase